MTIPLSRLVSTIDPERTVILFGAGSSIPSHAPSAADLIQKLSLVFGIKSDGFSLSEMASLAEQNASRKEVIEALRTVISPLRPTGGLINLPLYNWKSIYTTNYDTLIEQSYKIKGKDLVVYISNFNFTQRNKPDTTRLFKLHGSIDHDVCDGHNARIILTEADYELTMEYRQKLYDRLKGDLSEGQLIIIGHSLADAHIKEIAERAAKINSEAMSPDKITLLLYTKDDARASLFERRGFQVCFAGIDDFFGAMSAALPKSTSVFTSSDDPLDRIHGLRPYTIDVAHESEALSNIKAMYNGKPATYSDIIAGSTFERSITPKIVESLLRQDIACATILGASGVGKTTAARQVILKLKSHGYYVWEHKNDFTIPNHEWVEMSNLLNKENRFGVVFIDEAHTHLYQINEILDALATGGTTNLKLLCISSRNQWGPRIKSPAFFRLGETFTISKLSSPEIDDLLTLVDSNKIIRPLVEGTFSGYSPYERRRRLVERCEADTFVCLKNIFASEKFDDIILREYSDLSSSHQDVYKIVAAMENSGIVVHRQLVVRLLGISSESISSILDNLTDIISEYPINTREGIYGWKGRHAVIAEIVSKYKYKYIDDIVKLFDKVIECISPTYDIEVRTITELCSAPNGIKRIPDKAIQNRLFRRLISIAPGERVPRHRLIRNLIDMGEFEEAEVEVRMFEKDYRKSDGPVCRYKAMLMLHRAMKSHGLQDDDRVAILEDAIAFIQSSLGRHPHYNALYNTYCDVGFEIFKLTGSLSRITESISDLGLAFERDGDPDLGRILARQRSRMAGLISESEVPIIFETQEVLDE